MTRQRFEKLVEELRPEGSLGEPSFQAFFQTFFVLPNAARPLKNGNSTTAPASAGRCP